LNQEEKSPVTPRWIVFITPRRTSPYPTTKMPIGRVRLLGITARRWRSVWIVIAAAVGRRIRTLHGRPASHTKSRDHAEDSRFFNKSSNELENFKIDK
jgi:hypothetical protein